jgi:hypothetical protein
MRNDSVAAEVQHRQHARLSQSLGSYYAPADSQPRSEMRGRWSHVPLAELFREQGNVLQRERGGEFKTGHEPAHGSKSGTCVSIDAARGVWWCSSCRRGGSAVTYVMDTEGANHREAVEILRKRFGDPKRSVTVTV